jgi:hypothetical protein
MAFVIAGATPTIAISPTPLTPRVHVRVVEYDPASDRSQRLAALLAAVVAILFQRRAYLFRNT